MALARNTYRFALLAIAYAIAYEIGADDAVVPFAIGTFALLLGTVAHYARGPDDEPGGTGGDGSESGDDGDDDSDTRVGVTPHSGGLY